MLIMKKHMILKINIKTKKIQIKTKKIIIPNKKENIHKIKLNVKSVIKNFKKNKNGQNVKLVKHFLFKALKMCYSLFNVQVKNNLNQQKRKN